MPNAGGTLRNPLIWYDATAKSALLLKRNIYANRLAIPNSMFEKMDCLTPGTVSQLGTFPYILNGNVKATTKQWCAYICRYLYLEANLRSSYCHLEHQLVYASLHFQILWNQKHVIITRDLAGVVCFPLFWHNAKERDSDKKKHNMPHCLC